MEALATLLVVLVGAGLVTGIAYALVKGLWGKL